jgi:hypothetical protein
MHGRAAFAQTGSESDIARLDVGDAGVEIPQAVLAREGVNVNGARVAQGAWSGSRKGHRQLWKCGGK